jgi:multicomponent Na+:H+ antiporter subunit D
VSGGAALVVLLLATSLVTAAVTFVLPEHREAVRNAVNVGGALLKVLLASLLVFGVFTGAEFEWRVAFLPGADLVLRADPIPLLFVFLSALLWLTTTVYAIGYRAGDGRSSRFFGFFGLCASMAVGIALAGNLVTFLIFYELLTVATYPLVVHGGGQRARLGGRTYVAYATAGGAALLFGTAWLQHLVGSTEFGDPATVTAVATEQPLAMTAVFLVLITGLAVKAVLVPLHGWLPKAMVAPAPVSALLHAVAVVKAGVYGIVRVVHDLYGMALVDELGALTPLAVVATVTIVYGSLRALTRDDLKGRLAYSTVSQLSYIVLGVSVFGLTSTTGGLVHLVHQGIMKVTLFYGAGILDRQLGVTRASQMDGVGRRLPLTMAAFTVAALGMIGFPPTVGFVSKYYLGMGAVEAGQPWVVAVLAISGALNASYFLPLIARAWFRPAGEPADAEVVAEEGDSRVGVTTATSDDAVPPGPATTRGRWETDRWLLLPTLSTGASVLALGVLAGAPGSPLTWAAFIAEELMQP